MDWIKATVLGLLLAASLLMLPLLLPVLFIGFWIILAWFMIQVCKDNDKEP